MGIGVNGMERGQACGLEWGQVVWYGMGAGECSMGPGDCGMEWGQVCVVWNGDK